MAENGRTIELSDDETLLAASQEENSRLAQEIQYLKRRVVILRAMLNRFQAEVEGREEPSIEDLLSEAAAEEERVNNG